MERSVIAALARLARSPLRLSGTALPAGLVVVAEALALTVLLRREAPFARFLPYLEPLDGLGSVESLQAGLLAAVVAGCGLILFSRAVRLGCFMVGSAYLIGLLGCRPCLSVAHTYLACVFLMLSLSGQGSGARLLRAQLVVMYAGACINKAVDVDWWNGHYFDTLMITRHADPFYGWSASLLPERWFGAAMGAATILTQLALVICFLRRRWYRAGIVAAILFHSVMVLWMGTTFGPYYVSLMLSYLAFVDWPGAIQVDLLEASRLRGLISLSDADGRYRVVEPVRASSGPIAGLAVEIAGRRWEGIGAIGPLLLSHPLFYLAMVVPLAGWPLGRSIQTATVALVVLTTVAATIAFAGSLGARHA